ncbi:MAG: N-acetyltransferase [Candidatus Delongbacteria bacterium]|jgi:ribosomal protein S18 acetylase RimI-like enzyme|nr:N-acetyltransferase [Candidatus Delongbacteria bacterium]
MNIYSDVELIAVSKIHKSELGGADFLSSCSTLFIRYFYKNILKDKNNQLFIVEESNKVVGFAFFTLKKDVLFKKFVKDNLFRILFSPSALISLIKTIFIRQKKTLRYQYDSDLVYIAVRRDSRSKGYARKLLEHVETFCSDNSHDNYFLQVFKDNTNAVRFYVKYGFEVIEEYSARNKTKLLMRKSINIE